MTKLILTDEPPPTMEPRPKFCPRCGEPLGIYAPDDPGLAVAVDFHRDWCKAAIYKGRR